MSISVIVGGNCAVGDGIAIRGGVKCVREIDHCVADERPDHPHFIVIVIAVIGLLAKLSETVVSHDAHRRMAPRLFVLSIIVAV